MTIHWDQSKCIHAGVCVRTLPNVYNPKERPWVKIENASTEELKAQINKCPSGALSYTSEQNNKISNEGYLTCKWHTW